MLTADISPFDELGLIGDRAFVVTTPTPGTPGARQALCVAHARTPPPRDLANAPLTPSPAPGRRSKPMLSLVSLSAAFVAPDHTHTSEVWGQAQTEKAGVVWRGNSSAQSSHELLADVELPKVRRHRPPATRPPAHSPARPPARPPPAHPDGAG